MTHSAFDLQSLESRQLLAVGVSNFTASDLVVTAGQVVTLSVDLSATPGSPAAAAFFRDMNANNTWDPGIDLDLGSSTSRVGNTFYRNITIGANWTNSIHLVANGVSSTGEWSALPRTLELRVNRAPVFTSFEVTDGGNGIAATASARPSDDSGSIRAVTFFLDRNNNGRWDNGLDTSLGTAFTPQPDGSYRIQFSPDPATWPRVPHIVADTVDSDGDWSNDRRSGTINYFNSSQSPAPYTANYEVRQDWASSDGHRMTLSVDAYDNSAVRAVTFFLDYDDNGRWTPGVDDSLGTSYSSSNGHRHSITVTSDFGGRSGARVVVDISDYDDQWAGTRPWLTAQNGGTGFVTEFEAHVDSGTEVEFEMKYEFPRYFNRSLPTSANYFMFLDADKSGSYDSSIDTVLANGSTPVDIRGEARVRPRIVLGSNFHSGNWYGTAITSISSGDFTNAILSPVRIAVQRSSSTNLPQITSFDDQIGSSSEYGVVGATFTLSGTWEAPLGGRALSFFFDKNLNGHWDLGTDIDLGARAISGLSGSFTYTGTVLSSMVGYGAFAAVVGDNSNSSESWSQPVSEEVTQIFAAPTIRNVSSSALTAPAGSTFTFDINYSDDSSARAATAFIDTNGDGLFNGNDASYSATSRTIYSGTSRHGTMRLSIDTTGLTPGVYTIYFAVADHHRGHSSLPGGTTNGLWSHRYAMQVTLT